MPHFYDAMLGRIALRLDKIEEAIDYLTRARDRCNAPVPEHLRRSLGEAFLRGGRIEDAGREISAVLEAGGTVNRLAFRAAVAAFRQAGSAAADPETKSPFAILAEAEWLAETVSNDLALQHLRSHAGDWARLPGEYQAAMARLALAPGKTDDVVARRNPQIAEAAPGFPAVPGQDADFAALSPLGQPRSAEHAEAPAAGRICFVTNEFDGLFKNGGIGTSNTGLALALAASGYHVTVAFCEADDTGPLTTGGNFQEMQAAFALRGITLDYVPPYASQAFRDPRSKSYSVFRYLAAHSFDVVLFNDNGAQGFYALQAKQTAAFPNAPRMLVVTHGPTDWVLALNAMEYWNRDPVVVGFMERRCAALADCLISPSTYLIDWMQTQGWSMPADHRVVQNIVRTSAADLPPGRRLAGFPVKEIIFFGRQEIRKGIKLFCDAIDLLDDDELAGLTIVFLGKFSSIGALHSGIYIAERAERWPATLRIAADCDQRQALALLARPGVLAVLPSLAENSPCTVVECLQLGLPFLASVSGGTAELVDARDHPLCLFDPDPASLAERIRDCLPATPPAARPAVPQEDVQAAWLDVIAREVETARAQRACEPEEPEAATAPPVRISVCLAHTASQSAGPGVSAILDQACPGVDIILGWDGIASLTGLPAAGTAPVQVIRAEGNDCGTLRNAAAAQAGGDYLLFQDLCVGLRPGAIAALAQAAKVTGAHVLTGVPMTPRADQTLGQSLPIGACLEVGGFENCFGEGVLLVSAAAFHGSPGFPPGDDCALLDWLFLAGMGLRGHAQEVVPIPLFDRPSAAAPVFDAGHAVLRHREVMRAYADAPASIFRHIVENLMGFKAASTRNVEQALQHVSAPARAIARQMATLQPNHHDAIKALINYCSERRMVGLAIDLALMNSGLHLGEAVEAAARVTGADALAAIRRQPLQSLHSIDLSREVAGRVRPVHPLRPADMSARPGGIAAYPLGQAPATVKAATVCPPGTLRLRACVARDPAADDPADVALAICDPHARLSLDEQLRSPDDTAAWSGWRDLPGDGAEAVIEVVLREPLASTCDLYLLSRRRGSATGRSIGLVWKHVTADLQAAGGRTLSTIRHPTVLSALPLSVLRKGQLLTDASLADFPIFVPGERTLLHPVAGAVSLVRFQAAFPPGSIALRARMSVEDNRTGPVDFAIWIAPATGAAQSCAGLPAEDGFSGWYTVVRPLSAHYLEARLKVPAAEPMDIYIATRVSLTGDARFCHAYWHEFSFVETVADDQLAETSTTEVCVSAS